MRDTTRKDNVPVVIMIIPDIHDLSPGSSYRDLYGKMEAAFKALDIPTVNTFDDFQKNFGDDRSEEHTSELHHLVISYAVFCLKKKKQSCVSCNFPAAQNSPPPASRHRRSAGRR